MTEPEVYVEITAFCRYVAEKAHELSESVTPSRTPRSAQQELLELEKIATRLGQYSAGLSP